MVKLDNKIGVIVDSFRLPIREGLLKAKEVGAQGYKCMPFQVSWTPIT